MTTALPSVAFWHQSLPIESDFYDFGIRGGMAYFLDNPDRIDKMLISIGNFPAGANFMLDSLERYAGRWDTVRTLVDVIERRAEQGKTPEQTTLYLGGWHGPNMPAWEAASQAGKLEERLYRIIQMIPSRPRFKCSFAFDGSAHAYKWHDIVPRCFAYLMARGAPCYTEGAASPNSVLASCPSVTTAASAGIRSIPEGPNHGILLTNSWFIGSAAATDKDRPDRTDIKQNLVPRWRSEDRPIFIQAHDFNQRTHALPAFWSRTDSAPIDPANPNSPGADPVTTEAS